MRNVVLLTFDSLRADHCSFHGYDRETTPNLASMAESGTTFEHAVAPASRTNPAMAAAFTGEPLVARGQVADPTHSRSHLRRHGTVAERFREAGYATGAFCPNAYASRYYGFDRGFEDFEDFLFSSDLYRRLFEDHLGDGRVATAVRNLRNLLRRQEAFKAWETYVTELVEWADERESPFFLWAFSLDTHFPYLAPRAHRRWASTAETYYANWQCNRLIDALDVELTDRERQRIVDAYDDAIRYGDAFVGALGERLADHDPVFVVHGDHGEAFAERGAYGHFYPSLYEENVHVPLVVSAGEGRVESPTSLTDLPEILAGVADRGDDFDAPAHDWVVASDYDGRRDRNLAAVRTARWKYHLAEKGGTYRRELYDLATDPGERDDRVGEGAPLEEPLASLAGRRLDHESEVLALRAAGERVAGREASARAPNASPQ